MKVIIAQVFFERQTVQDVSLIVGAGKVIRHRCLSGRELTANQLP